MRDIVISEDPFSIRYVPDQYKTQQMSDDAVDDCLPALKFVPDWFVTSKMLEKLDNALHANHDILFYNENFNKVTFIACQRHILAAGLDKIKSDTDNNFYEDDRDTIIHVRLCNLRGNFKNHKALKKKISE